MGFASLKVQAEDKRLFDRLLHEVALQTGKNVSQHELFHRILAQALSHKAELTKHRPSPRRRDWSRYFIELDEPTNVAEDVDKVVYGL